MGASDIYSLAIGNKGGGGVKACDKCTATLANIAQLPGLKIPDMAVPEFRWKYEGVVELADGSGHLGFEEDTEFQKDSNFWGIHLTSLGGADFGIAYPPW
ncbi:hypothetical protein TWF191_008042 [Orbilia oligospora]|uniref:Uncharacterized protein n=1 Tax=Orbilia oligospora TaxID=2813651 RepID=A0A7C8V0Z7_ORBOL|nr:hypothetical protein TWF679_004472 [Orbilia oligospora]KAF3218837.1 hypothetical protein TWF191_008042 [Orbilia oligospora]